MHILWQKKMEKNPKKKKVFVLWMAKRWKSRNERHSSCRFFIFHNYCNLYSLDLGQNGYRVNEWFHLSSLSTVRSHVNQIYLSLYIYNHQIKIIAVTILLKITVLLILLLLILQYFMIFLIIIINTLIIKIILSIIQIRILNKQLFPNCYYDY